MADVIITNSGYLITWEEYNLTIKVSRLDVHKDGHVTAFIKISLKDKDKTFTLLPAAQINLSAPRTRSELANTLTEKNSTIPWRDVIDYLCREIQEKAWVGEPGETIEVTDETELERPTYLLEPVIMQGVPTVIFGEKGVHKTILSLLFSICIYLPWIENPFELKTNAHKSVVAMLDWESDKKLTMYNVQRLLKGHNLTYYQLNYRRCKLPLADDIDQIAAFLDDKECDTIMIDSLGAACGGDLMKADIALRFFEALRSLNRTSLLIAQTSKNEEGKKTIFGSTYFGYYSRNIFELKKSVDALDKDETKVALFHTEGNYSGKYDPIGFRLNFTPETIKVTREPVTYGEFLEKINRQQQLLEILKDGPLKNEQIADKLQISQGNVRATTKRLSDKKKIVKTENGAWGLLIGDSVT